VLAETRFPGEFRRERNYGSGNGRQDAAFLGFEHDGLCRKFRKDGLSGRRSAAAQDGREERKQDTDGR